MAEEVEVRTRFRGNWVPGFEVVDDEVMLPDDRVLVRRRSDGTVLPTTFGRDEVRPTRWRGVRRGR